jgi:hypothetical protein
MVAGGLEWRDAYGRRGLIMASLEVSLCEYFGFSSYKRLTTITPKWLRRRVSKDVKSLSELIDELEK